VQIDRNAMRLHFINVIFKFFQPEPDVFVEPESIEKFKLHQEQSELEANC
jgi:hypothetical protein